MNKPAPSPRMGVEAARARVARNAAVPGRAETYAAMHQLRVQRIALEGSLDRLRGKRRRHGHDVKGTADIRKARADLDALDEQFFALRKKLTA